MKWKPYSLNQKQAEINWPKGSETKGHHTCIYICLAQMLASSAHSLKDSVQFAEIGSLRNESGYGSVEAHTSREESPSQHTKSSARESREKKDSLKKRESGMGKKVNGYNIKRKQPMLSTQSPMRYSVPQPKAVDFEPPKDPVFTSHEPYPFLAPDGKTELKKPTDQ